MFDDQPAPDSYDYDGRVASPRWNFFQHLERLGHRRRERHEVRVFLLVNGYIHELQPNRRLQLMTQVTAGHTINYAIAYADTNGNPMLTTPTPDSAPSWSNAPSAPGIDTLTEPTPVTATLATNPGDAASTDTVSVVVVVAGKSFSASDNVTISVAPQTLGSISLVATVS